MNETIFDWDDLRLFLAVARGGGLAAAAQATGKSAPTLGRRMLALEERLGQELFRRLPRGYELTQDGHKLLKSASTVEQGIKPISMAAAKPTASRIKISAGAWVTHVLSKNIATLNTDSGVVLQFISADHVLDIAHRDAVIGVRNQRPEQISLAGRHTNRIRFAVYAIDTDIKTWATVTSNTPSARWVRENAGHSPGVEVSSPRNALDMALAGAVRVVLPTFVGDNTPPLQRVSDEIDELAHMQWLVTHHEERHRPEVRNVIDRIYDVLTTHSQSPQNRP